MIETPRLFLRQPVLGDFAPIAAMSADPAVARFVGGRIATREESWIRLLRFVGHWQLLGHGLFAVVEKASGAFAGYTGLAWFERGIGPAFDADPEAGWAFAPAFQGLGYATEAGRAAHGWFDARFVPPRTVCMVDPDNAPSLGVAAKLGYHPFGETQYRDKRLLTFERDASRLPDRL